MFPCALCSLCTSVPLLSDCAFKLLRVFFLVQQPGSSLWNKGLPWPICLPNSFKTLPPADYVGILRTQISYSLSRASCLRTWLKWSQSVTYSYPTYMYTGVASFWWNMCLQSPAHVLYMPRVISSLLFNLVWRINNPFSFHCAVRQRTNEQTKAILNKWQLLRILCFSTQL